MSDGDNVELVDLSRVHARVAGSNAFDRSQLFPHQMLSAGAHRFAARHLFAADYNYLMTAPSRALLSLPVQRNLQPAWVTETSCIRVSVDTLHTAAAVSCSLAYSALSLQECFVLMSSASRLP